MVAWEFVSKSVEAMCWEHTHLEYIIYKNISQRSVRHLIKFTLTKCSLADAAVNQQELRNLAHG